MNASPLQVYILEQPGPGTIGKVYQTPIHDCRTRTETKITKTELSKHIQTIRKQACQDNVSDDYVKDAISYNNVIVVMFQTVTEMVNTYDLRSKPTKRVPKEVVIPIGFLLANPDEHGFFIDVICSLRNTGELLKYFIQYCEDQPISLHALANVLSYYPKFGFEFRKSCDDPVLVRLPESIQTRNIRAKPFPKKESEAYNDDDFGDLMLTLVENGFAVKEGCVGKMTRNVLKEGACGDEGFTMMRCPPTVGGTTRRRQRRRRTGKTMRKRVV
jgi:hypothetical protein